MSTPSAGLKVVLFLSGHRQKEISGQVLTMSETLEVKEGKFSLKLVQQQMSESQVQNKYRHNRSELFQHSNFQILKLQSHDYIVLNFEANLK